MPLDPEILLNWPFPDVEQSYTAQQSILYALGIGFGSDPCDRAELPFVYEQLEMKTAPMMAVVLGYPGFWMQDPASTVTWQSVLHGEQWLELFAPLPSAGTVIGRNRVVEVSDRGGRAGGLVIVERDVIDKATDHLLARATMSIVCRVDGGFGGARGRRRPLGEIPDRAPDRSVTFATLPQQALIYRLSGDDNPLHADPDMAATVGFDRPILHGLSTYGFAGRAILQLYCGYDPARLKGLDVRFTAPVFPGEHLRIDCWEGAEDISFRATAVERDRIVLNKGRARVA